MKLKKININFFCTYPVSKFQIRTERSMLHVAISGLRMHTSTPVMEPWWKLLLRNSNSEASVCPE